MRQVAGIGAAIDAGARRADGVVVDPGAGVILRRKVGDPVTKCDTLAELYLARDVEANPPLALLSRAYSIGLMAGESRPLVLDRVCGL